MLLPENKGVDHASAQRSGGHRLLDRHVDWARTPHDTFAIPARARMPFFPSTRPTVFFITHSPEQEPVVLAATGIEIRGGSRLLLEGATFRIAPGDRIGLVGRNGSGKTTLTKVLAGVGTPSAGHVTTSGEVGYLPQDPRTGDLEMVARDRILSARGMEIGRP